MARISIDGKKYEVVETLSFHHVGMPAKAVKYDSSPTGERIAVKQGGKWGFWAVEDRLQKRSQFEGMNDEEQKRI